ncbi:hypothetical protein [Jiangella sp. DSM 45060]|uniref:hypothetical protein n=1 Tax=Jiangella sp. DSM 45060 TaxID=1798224 RepID=UPI00087CF70F|nr:hypothetical protein [Jiangella sp. DSM 45060]SDS30451.1 hypothetical protein SAMN04515669_0795 [Jiangella sp. DSM 45060]
MTVRGRDQAEAALARAGFAVQPVELVAVLPALRTLLGGLRRGQVVAVDGMGALPLALLAGATAAGAWTAVVGLSEFGVLAASGLGADLGRVVVVEEPGAQWAEVVAVLLTSVEVVVVRPPVQVGGQLSRRLVALARRHGTALVCVGDWEGAQTRLRVASSLWVGPEHGRGHLRGRRVKVEAYGRGAGARPRSAWLWLPGPDGTVSGADLEALDTADPASPAGPPSPAGLEVAG